MSLSERDLCRHGFEVSRYAPTNESDVAGIDAGFEFNVGERCLEAAVAVITSRAFGVAMNRRETAFR